MSEFENHNMDTSQINTNGYRWEARNRPGRRLASPLCLACDEIDRLRARLERADGLLQSARCPDLSCDNEGTRTETAYDKQGYPFPEPAPCEWCHERDAFLRGD